MMGEVVGVNTAGFSKLFAEGLGFAVSSNTVTKIVPALISNGEYDHPWLGVYILDIKTAIADLMDLADTKGAFVDSVVPDSPADRAGLRGSNNTVQYNDAEYSVGGDIVIALDGNEIRNISEFGAYMLNFKSAGDEMVMDILRDGQVVQLVAVLDRWPESLGADDSEETNYTQLDATLVVFQTEQGMMVIELFPDDAPNHAANFASLAEEGFYDDTLFHRIIPSFMIQGGDPKTRSDSGASQSEWGTGGTDTMLADEFNDIMHNRGIVSMAHSTSPGSAGSQFFVVHQNSNFLDAQHTVFGRLATQESYDTLDAIAAMPTVQNDRPADPDSVRVTSAQTIARDEAVASGLVLLDQGPPSRMQPAEPAPPVGRTYESEALNLSMSFPVGWVLRQVGGDDNPDVVAVGPAMGILPPSIAVYVEAGNGSSLDEVIQNKAETLQALQEGGTFEVLSKEKVTINGREMFVLEAGDAFQTPRTSLQIKYQEVTAVVDDSVYTFLFAGDADSYDAVLPLFEETVSSFSVLESQEPEPHGPVSGNGAGATVLNPVGTSVPGCEETDECFIPSVVRVYVGGEVTWINEDAAAHTVTSGVLADGGPDGVFDSGLFAPETEFSHTFEEAGEYPYFCMVHPWMSGLVIVQDR